LRRGDNDGVQHGRKFAGGLSQERAAAGDSVVQVPGVAVRSKQSSDLHLYHDLVHLIGAVCLQAGHVSILREKDTEASGLQPDSIHF